MTHKLHRSQTRRAPLQPTRLATVDFIKETLVALPAAPSADEFSRLRAERVRAAERRVAEEREAARLAKAKFEEHRAQQESCAYFTETNPMR